ncbi:universal stress protein UspA-like protein [Halovivax ruber XH-70]|uniref:Universal stress protein UspA-like protein n=1 Tax=Halovivax ruber (strain DSM 18193 / JCM 13892 / XH-70) TaxID=797302 RepID=L0IDW3_HALRX|nr:universal stress protein [Halovivax ruber]AGB17023.1 universal stress protein UspA-like protein [Halovivax ruber XH-70]
MYDAILAATDGSDGAAAALEHAIALGETTGATVHVVTVVESTDNPMKFGTAEVDELNRAAEEIVDEIVDAYDGEGVDITGDVRRGRPSEALRAYAEEADVDLIVVGERGAGGVAGALLGSTADRLSRTATVPVTVVPVEAE